MKKCKCCKKENVRELNGIAVSKWCTACKKIKEAEIKEKNKIKKEKLKEEKLAKIQRKLEKKLASKKYQKSRFKSLHKKAWKLISDYVRQQSADEFGFNYCYTCGRKEEWKVLQCGHFFHGKLDFDLRNLKPQCAACNMYKSGDLANYAVRLVKELGAEGMEQLRLDANTTMYTIEDLENIIIKYSQK